MRFIRIFLCYYMPMLYIICGPTGSGKTEIGKLLSDRLNAPIINADAFQIYKDMNIGTAKIDKDDPYYARHHLLDIITPEEDFSVMQYQKLFHNCVEELSKEYKDIIVVGGTGLYIRASIYDYHFDEQKKDDVSDLEKMSNEELYQMLETLDKEACKTIHMNNRKRVIRAISIARTSTLTKSENINAQEHKIIYPDVRILMINPDREKLYENINKRVDEMFVKGLLEEVKSLQKAYKFSITARAAIGYKEVLDALENNTSIDAAKELIKQRSRNYAKRQITFFKHQFPTIEIYEDKESLLKAI